MTSRILVVLFVLAVTSPAQAGEKPTPKPTAPRQDAKALALLDQADAVMYSARRLGLKDLQYRHVLGNLPGVWVAVKWMAPDRAAGKVEVGPEAAPAMKFFARSQGEMLKSTALGVVDMMTGKENRKVYEKDEILFVAPGKVKIVARSARSQKIFQEHVIAFDDRGLPASTRSVKSGTTIDLSVTFVQRDRGKYFVDRVVSVKTTAEQKVDTTMTFTYAEQGGYHFPSRIDSVTGAGKTVMTFEGIKANQGLVARDFD